MKPILSIVIANYNYGQFLEDAIRSVLVQGMGDSVELIICDGGSTDNSVEVIKKYSDKIAWWVSEKDGGQSAAFNKGFNHANGRFLTWLNADDVLMPDALKRFETTALLHPECEWFVGGSMWLDKELKILRMSRGRSFSEIRYKMGDLVVWGPSSFFTKELLNRVGGVDERFQYMMDIDLWLRFASIAKARYLPCCKYVWGFRLHESAKTSGINFSSSGKSDPKHPMWIQLQNERMWMKEHYSPSLKKSVAFKILSTKIGPALMSRWDTFRYKGRYYRDLRNIV